MDYTIERLERLLSEVDSLMLGIFDRYSEKRNLDLIDIANYEAEFEARQPMLKFQLDSLDVVDEFVRALYTEA